MFQVNDEVFFFKDKRTLMMYNIVEKKISKKIVTVFDPSFSFMTFAAVPSIK